MKGLQAVDAIERDKHEFVPGAPQWPEPISIKPPEAIPLPPPETDTSPSLVPEHSPLDDIANMLRAATYGEMIELAAEMWAARGDGDINLDTLPAVLHRWSTRRSDDGR